MTSLLQRAKSLVAAATQDKPTPWIVERDIFDSSSPHWIKSGMSIVARVGNPYVDGLQVAEFIAAAPTLVTELVAECERLLALARTAEATRAAAVADRDSLAAKLAAVEAERDRLRHDLAATEAARLVCADKLATVERSTAESIAAWLDEQVAIYREEWERRGSIDAIRASARAAHDAVSRIAADIRAGAWRKEGK